MNGSSIKPLKVKLLAGEQKATQESLWPDHPDAASEKFDCYWVGSLDFNFLGKSRGFPKHLSKLNFLQRGQQQPSKFGYSVTLFRSDVLSIKLLYV